MTAKADDIPANQKWRKELLISLTAQGPALLDYLHCDRLLSNKTKENSIKYTHEHFQLVANLSINFAASVMPQKMRCTV
jgi:hypothetical protein